MGNRLNNFAERSNLAGLEIPGDKAIEELERLATQLDGLIDQYPNTNINLLPLP